MTVDLRAHFQQFLENISLGHPQVPRMNSAARTISDFLCGSYGIPASYVFLQGSYPNGTAIEPVDGGEYDIDIVAVCIGAGVDATDALVGLERRFAGDGRFRDRLHRPPKKPCVRLDYAEDNVGRFHVDVVPAHPTGLTSPPLQVPRRNEGWHGSAPAEYTAWCEAQGEIFVRTVKMMKRWRDEQQGVRTAIKSIVLQVLVAEHIPRQDYDDASRLTETFRNLHNALKSLARAPQVLNPVLRSENLAARWTTESFRSFVIELDEAVQWADKAAGATDEVEASDAWREILGDDFPVRTPSQLGFTLGDTSHAHRPSDMGWAEQLDGRYHVSISATQQRGRRGQTRRHLGSDDLVFAPNKLHFKANVAAPNHVDVWWQVANTGGHARDRGGLRGQIFKGRDLRDRPTDQTENWESTAYTGKHLIRALLVRNNTVVAQSEWFTVNVYANGHMFRL